jgi:uncharacterized iron-regulated membrane protein
LYKIHLWLGIISGIILFIICLTGTLLVFQEEIVNFLKRDKIFVSHPGKSVLKVDDLVAKVEQNTNSKVFAVRMLDCRINTAMIYVMRTKTENIKNTETKPEIHFESYDVDPYTGEILGKDSLLTKFFHVIVTLHTSLFLPRQIGKIVVGSATLIFFIVALSGLCLWLPANFRNIKAWKNSFLVRFRKRKNQLLGDFHKTLGFYALIPILLMSLTGLMMSFTWFSNGVLILFNVAASPYIPVKSLPKNPDAKRLPIDFFDKKADELLAPHKDKIRFIQFPERDDDPVMI